MLYNNGVSSCQIAGAIVLTALKNIQGNDSSISGFPQITVSETKNRTIKITLSYMYKGQNNAVDFSIDNTLAFNAGKMFKNSFNCPTELFELVENAIIELEALCR